MDEVARIARERKPKLILAGWSAYPRQLDFARFREIADEVGALLMVDMAHFAGLVAAGLHPSPVPYADVVTTTIHKTIGGARGGLILCQRGARQEDRLGGLPRPAGRPAEHVIAGKAVAFRIAQSDAFRERQQRTLDGAQALAEELLERRPRRQRPDRRHRRAPVLVDLRESELDGQQAEDRLHEIGITVNRNAVPFDPRPPMVSSGLRDRHAGARDARLPASRTSPRSAGSSPPRCSRTSTARRGELAERVAAIAERYPLYAQLGAAGRGLSAAARRAGGARCQRCARRMSDDAVLRLPRRARASRRC